MIGEALELMYLMRRDQDRRGRVRQVLGNQRQRAAAHDGIETLSRFVEQQDARAMGQRHDQLKPPAVAFGQRFDCAIVTKAEGATEPIGICPVPSGVVRSEVVQQRAAGEPPI